MSLLLSVAICTFNRSSLLPHALDSLLDQSLNSDDFEIIIIDNASTDKTYEVVREYQKKHPKIRYLKEMTPGISSARNRAMREAAGKYLAFLDDDARAEHRWLEELSAPVRGRAVEPVPACVAGPVFLDWAGGRPSWFPSKYEALLCRYEPGNTPRFLGADGYLLTTNALFEVEILRGMEGFRTYLGRTRKQLLGGEDNDIYQRLFKAGHGIFYQPSAKVFHGVPKERQSRGYLLRRLYWDGVSQPLLPLSRKQPEDKSYRAWAESYYDLIRFSRALLNLTKGAIFFDKNIFWDAVYAICQEAGRFYTDLRIAMGVIR